MAWPDIVEALAAAPQTESTMPVLFIGRGSLMNASKDTGFRRAWAEVGRWLPGPKATIDHSKPGPRSTRSVRCG